MTIHEVSERYQIPEEILEEYENWGLCGTAEPAMGGRQYKEQDLEYLSLIMTLYEIGFQSGEVEEYMRLLLRGRETEQTRMEMLNRHRKNTLDEIHYREKQLDRVDYLRFKLRKSRRKKNC